MLRIRRAERLCTIAGLLQKVSGRVTTLDLAAQLGVSQRTVEYDLAELRRRGTAVSGTIGRRGGVALASDFNRDRSLAEPSQSESSIRRPLTGRTSELERLTSLQSQARRGVMTVVGVVGDPGIGKTRILQELTVAAEPGAIVRWGRCAEGAPAFWPWTRALGEMIPRLGPAELSSRMESGAADRIATSIPELKTLSPSAAPVSGEDPQSARYRLLAAMCNLLGAIAQTTPLLIVLDDFHWADESSADLLSMLAFESGPPSMFVAFGARSLDAGDGGETRALLSELARAESFHRIDLDGLDREESGRLFEAIAGVDADTERTAALYELTEGNPFFLTEIARLGEFESTTALPDAVQDVIARRLESLSYGCHKILTRAAVLGRNFQLDHLRARVPDMRDANFEEALQKNIVTEQDESSGVYQFAHALIHRVLYDEISPLQRPMEHARAAERLESFLGEDAWSHASEIAHHLVLAEDQADPIMLARYSLLAGRQAMSSAAFGRAVEHFTRSRDASADPAEKAVAAHELGRALVAAGREMEAVDPLYDAFEYFDQSGDIERAVAIASHPLSIPHARQPKLADMVARAIEQAEPDSLGIGWLQSRIVNQIAEYEQALVPAIRAIAIARANNEPALEMWTYGRLAYTACHDLKPEIGYENVQASLRVGDRVDDLQAHVNTNFWGAISLSTMGDLSRATTHADRCLENAEKSRNQTHVSQAREIAAEVFAARGEWQKAFELVDAHRPETQMFFRQSEALRARLLGEIGDQDQLIASRTTFSAMELNGKVAIGIALASTAHITGLVEFVPLAEAALDMDPIRLRPLERRSHHAARALLAVQRQDQLQSEREYEFLRVWDRQFDIWRGTGVSFDRLLGLLARVLGDRGMAIVHVEKAIQACASGGFMPELARAYDDIARLLLASGRRTDLSRAQHAVSQGISIAERLGMKPLQGRFAGHLKTIEQRARGRPVRPGGLTEREVEVLRLLASGNSNSEIAETLIISPNTVYQHVGNILSKTESANRAEAATYAAVHDLL